MGASCRVRLLDAEDDKRKNKKDGAQKRVAMMILGVYNGGYT